MILLYNNILSNNLLINYFLKNSQTFLQSCRRSLCSFCMIFFTTLIILVWSLNLKNRKIIINILLQHTEENMFKLFFTWFNSFCWANCWDKCWAILICWVCCDIGCCCCCGWGLIVCWGGCWGDCGWGVWWLSKQEVFYYLRLEKISSKMKIKFFELFFDTLWLTIFQIMGLLGRQMSVQPKHKLIFK